MTEEEPTVYRNFIPKLQTQTFHEKLAMAENDFSTSEKKSSILETFYRMI